MGSDCVDRIDWCEYCICSAQPLCLQAIRGDSGCPFDCLPSACDGCGRRHGGVPLTRSRETALQRFDRINASVTSLRAAQSTDRTMTRPDFAVRQCKLVPPGDRKTTHRDAWPRCKARQSELVAFLLELDLSGSQHCRRPSL